MLIISALVTICAGCAKRRVAAASLAIWLPPRRRCVREHERRCGVAAFCVGGVRRLSPAWAASTRVSLRCRWFFAFRCTRSRVGAVFANPAVAAVSLPIWAPWPPPCQRKPTIGRGVVGDHFVRARRRSGGVFCMGVVCSRVGYMWPVPLVYVGACTWLVANGGLLHLCLVVAVVRGVTGRERWRGICGRLL